jgi:hypothetical protein
MEALSSDELHRRDDFELPGDKRVLCLHEDDSLNCTSHWDG